MKLNEQQALIINHPADASCLVMAGPGSGKTTVTARRGVEIAKGLKEGAFLQMLTFSNKASAEMKDRVTRLGGRGLNIKFDTFHSFGMKLLRDDLGGYGLEEGFSLLTEQDMRRSIRALAKQHGLNTKEVESDDRKRLDPVAWLGTWSLAKQAGFNVTNPENKNALSERLVKAFNLDAGELKTAWLTLQDYEAEKRKSNSVDFDDLLYMPLLRLARDERYRENIQSTIGYITVDESQDTNRIQYEIVKYLALNHCGVTCVGDDDQSIYGWRGAEISNMKRFAAQFKAAELRLEQNYRSTKAIVNSSADLIDNNQERLSKRPYSEGAEGTALKGFRFRDSREMADAIADQISDRLSAGVQGKELAVLYRTNRMAMLLEQALRRRSIQYHVVGGMSLFDRAEVVAVTSALRLAMNPKDRYALKSLIPYISGFGEASAYCLLDAMEEDESLSITALPATLGAIPARSLQALKAFMTSLRFDGINRGNVEDFIKWCAVGPMKLLEREKDDLLRANRERHLESLSTDIAAELAERQVAEPDLTWRDVVLEVALRDVRQAESEGQSVTLSTIHRSKGLEWQYVMLAGVSEGLMPLNARSEVSDEDAGFIHGEEERRLAYVGITRAKEDCTLYHADVYFFPGMKENKTFEPSRFLAELGVSMPDVVTCNDDFDDYHGSSRSFDRSFFGVESAPKR